MANPLHHFNAATLALVAAPPYNGNIDRLAAVTFWHQDVDPPVFDNTRPCKVGIDYIRKVGDPAAPLAASRIRRRGDLLLRRRLVREAAIGKVKSAAGTSQTWALTGDDSANNLVVTSPGLAVSDWLPRVSATP